MMAAWWRFSRLRVYVLADAFRFVALVFRSLIHDRDRIFARRLDDSIKALGIEVLRSPIAIPKANAICERVIGTIRRECLDWLIPLSELHLRSVLTEWVAHYNRGRPHSRLGPGVPDPPECLTALRKSESRHRTGEGIRVLAKSVHAVGRGTVANVLKVNGIEPAPERGKHTRWSTFLKAHWKIFAASDFFSIEVWTGRGLVTNYVLFVISLADRIVEVLGVTAKPDEGWILQIGRNLVDCERGALREKRYMIIDRDTKYSEQFRRLVRESGPEIIRLAPMSPNLNGYAERFVRSIKDECLNRMIFIGQASLRRAIKST